MREVYESRATYVEHKKRLNQNEKEAVVRDMQDLDQQLSAQDRALMEKRIAAEIAKRQ